MNKKKRNKHLKSIAASGGAASMKKLTKKQRSEKASWASSRRWSIHRSVERAMEKLK